MKNTSKKQPGLIGRFVQRQKRDVVSDNQKQLWTLTTGAVRSVLTMHQRPPARVETFAQAVARKKLSAKDLAKGEARHKAMHLFMYALAGAALVYALYIALNVDGSAFTTLAVLVWGLCMAVHGYLEGYRAWQIQHRRLIRLQDAIRIPSTYLVL